MDGKTRSHNLLHGVRGHAGHEQNPQPVPDEPASTDGVYDFVVLRSERDRLSGGDDSVLGAGEGTEPGVLVGDRLYVRNAEEAAAYKLPLEAGN